MKDAELPKSVAETVVRPNKSHGSALAIFC
ncbi:MAG: hypothetical protein QOJ15_1500 [Bradyrhizobium sp.]|jgi:hypothetical protein|nr:hypothetical protein [Bradyrhizobium sp.]